MKVKQIKQRGEPVWLVDGKVNGKRKRMFFESEAKAKRWLAAEAKDTTCQQWWLDLNSGQRADMMNAFMRAEDEGFKLLTAVSHYTEQGRGQLFLKRITLGEAVGTLTFHPSRYDEGFKKDTVKDSSGYFRTRVAKGCSMKTLYTKRCVLFNFRDFVGDKKQVATITVEDIEGWLDAGGCKGKQWTPVTKENYASDVKAFFNWLKKRKHVSENPCDAMEQILDIEMEPEILTPKQCEELLKTTLEVDRTMLSYIVLMLFCGIRPSEAMRLKSSAVQIDKKRVVLSGKQTKTRRRRIVDLSDNAIAWWKMGASFPLQNADHRWDDLRAAQRGKWKMDKWPHDCLRHSFCSYYLAAHENAAQTALQAGHTEGMLFKHYRVLVDKEDADQFWNIYPETALGQLRVVA